MHDTKYVQEIKLLIEKIKTQYSINDDTIGQVRDILILYLELTIHEQLFWKFCCWKSGGSQIAYSSHKKKSDEELE